MKINERYLDWALDILGFVLITYLLWYAFVGHLPRGKYASIFLSLSAIIFFTNQVRGYYFEEDENKGGRVAGALKSVLPSSFTSVLYYAPAVLYSLLILGSAGIAVYINTHYDYLLKTAPIVGYTNTDVIIGWIAIIIVFLITLFAYGKMITTFLSLVTVFVYGGPWMPGILRNSGMSLQEIPIQGAMALAGVYGSLTGLAATWVAVFVVFAGLLQGYGLLDLVLDAAKQVTSRFRTGVVQIAIFSSMLFGMVIGSAAANTATTGSMTIPMMKEQGVRSDFAGAIEAVASSAGQIMPPVMGTAAFLMADILSISYQTVIIYATIPALLFYMSASLSTHLITYKYGATQEPTPQKVEFDKVEMAFFLVPFGTLIYTLFVLQLSPFAAGRYVIVSTIVAMLGKALVQDQISGLRTFLVESIDGFQRAAVSLAPLIGVIGAISFSIALIEKTGVTGRIAFLAVNLAGGSLFLILFIAMVLALILGMGMPTVAVYLLMVVFVAPALLKMGVKQPITHIYVFYFGMLSAITPPVAIAAVIGSNISGASFTATAKQALKVGIAGFLIPYVFVVHQNIIFWNVTTPLTVVFVVVGIIAIDIAAIGYDGHNLSLVGRGLFLLIGLLALFGPLMAEFVGALVIACLILLPRLDIVPNQFTNPIYK